MRSKTLLVFFFALLIVPGVFAIGATGCGARYVDYEPYARIDFEHTIINAHGFRVTLEGVWADSIVITEEIGNTIRGYLTIPPNWDTPGTMNNFVVFHEIAQPGRTGTAVALTRVRCPIYVRVPYPGQYLEFDVKTADINEGDTARATYYVGSRGDDPVDDARLTITVEKNGTTHATYSERMRRIQPREEITDTVDLTTQELAPGIYSVFGELSYATDTIRVERSIRVGELDVNITNYTRMVPTADFTRLEFVFENLWNSPVNEVVFTYRIANEQQRFAQVRSETFSIRPFATTTIRSIAETPGIVEGTAFIEYTIAFDGNTKSGTLPILFEREGPALNVELFVLIGILITIMIALAVIFTRRTKREKPASGRKPPISHPRKK
jgi:hypothetical protein